MDLLQLLDDQWSSGKADLASLIQQVPASDQLLARELCAADLEWRWRVAHNANSTNANTAADDPPSAADYESLLSNQWGDIACQRDLLEAEWCARSLWGDQPDVDQFAKRLPSVDGWQLSLAGQIDGLVPLGVILEGNSLKRPLTIRVSHRFVIGRQGSGDPQAPGWRIENQRLIVANSHYRTISREQLLVRRTRTLEIELTNQSQVAPFQSAEVQLEPGKSIRLALPAVVEVGEVKVRFLMMSDTASDQ